LIMVNAMPSSLRVARAVTYTAHALVAHTLVSRFSSPKLVRVTLNPDQQVGNSQTDPQSLAALAVLYLRK